MEQAAGQIGEYWDSVDQNTLLSELKGIFEMTGTANKAFVSGHTHDISKDSGNGGMFSATTLNTAMQRAMGDNKAKFTLAIMHSAVATNLENMKLLDYLKYTDKDGVERDLAIGTLNGRTVLVDDNMPVSTDYASGGVYTVTLGGTFAAGDTITVMGKTAVLTATTAATPTAAAGAAVTALGSPEAYTVTRSGAVITLTEKSGSFGAGLPEVSAVSEEGTVTAGTITAPEGYSVYTTYVLGDGAFEYTNCGVRVPYEMDRDPAKNGGQTMLYGRQRKIFAPYGISWTASGVISPTDEQLEDGGNWELANSNESVSDYFPHKAIPIARIISRG